MNFYSPTHYKGGSWQSAEREALGETGHRMKNCIENVEVCFYTERGEHINIVSVLQN